MANIEFTPPLKGINKGLPADKPMPLSSEDMDNVRIGGFSGRIVVVQRPGLGKWGAGIQIGDAENPVVSMVTVASVV